MRPTEDTEFHGRLDEAEASAFREIPCILWAILAIWREDE
jgi:hypothetical protein